MWMQRPTLHTVFGCGHMQMMEIDPQYFLLPENLKRLSMNITSMNRRALLKMIIFGHFSIGIYAGME